MIDLHPMVSRINGSINDLHENGLLRLLAPVGKRATPPADISSPNYFVEVPSQSLKNGILTCISDRVWPVIPLIYPLTCILASDRVWPVIPLIYPLTVILAVSMDMLSGGALSKMKLTNVCPTGPSVK
jgi:hypothetical protein